MSFVRIHVTVEGQTEERFVRNTLCNHLGAFSLATDVRRVLTSKDARTGKSYRGGFRRRAPYQMVKRDISNWLKEDRAPEARFTTMFDLYALPNDFPGHAKSARETDPYKKVAVLEEELAADLGDRRFVPYIQLHEFETLIMADPQALDWEYLEHDVAIANLVSIAGTTNPELINDGPTTAPSKRILNEIPEYDKATAGPIVAGRIGIQTLRSKCAHFGDWLTRLEALGR